MAETPPPVELRVESVSRSFESHTVLDNISVDINNGDIVAIVGGSGSGKTVLMHHLAGLLPAQSGRVLAADHDAPSDGESTPLVDLALIPPDKLDAIRLHWAIVFQHNALFSGNVFDNIALWLREHTELSENAIAERVRDSLSAAALDPDIVMLKERDTLSGGMAKRVAIARAIATNPVVIFYDEPTTGLDPIVGAHIHELIWNLHHQVPASWPPGVTSTPAPRRTSIIVTHDRDLIRRLRPRIVMLADASIAFDGSYDEFTRTPNPRAQQYLRAMPVLHARPPGGDRAS